MNAFIHGCSGPNGLRTAAGAAMALALAFGPFPARAGPSTYDIDILLGQHRPWARERNEGIPGSAPANAPDRGSSDGRPHTARDIGSRPMEDRPGHPVAANGPPEGADHAGPYSFFLYGGVASKEVFSGSHRFNTTDTHLVAAGATARLYRFAFGLEIEGEFGLGRRFGQDDLWEIWSAAGVRWRDFPWNHIVYTTLGLALVGLDYTTKVPPHETEFNQNKNAKLLNFFSPELTLALPEHPGIALMLRLHHRSSLFGLWGKGEASIYSVGLRFQL